MQHCITGIYIWTPSAPVFRFIEIDATYIDPIFIALYCNVTAPLDQDCVIPNGPLYDI